MKNILISLVVALTAFATTAAHSQTVDGRISGFSNLIKKAKVEKGPTPSTLTLNTSEEAVKFHKEASEEMKKREDENLAWIFWKDGKLLFEGYHPKVKPENYLISFSMVKSMVSFLVGSAMCEGKLALSDHAVKYVPDLADSAYVHRSIDDLLQMRTGIPFKEDPQAMAIFGNVLAQRATYDETLLSIKASAFSPKQYADFNYDSNVTEVLGRVLAGATGNAEKYFSEKLWSKIGAQADAWFAVDMKGRPMSAGGLYAQPRDFLRVGIHLLEVTSDSNGDACLRQYVQKATSPLSTINHPTYFGYGYQFWSRNKLVRNNDRVFELVGLWGQRIVVDPNIKVVALGLSTKEGDLARFYALVNKLRSVNM